MKVGEKMPMKTSQLIRVDLKALMRLIETFSCHLDRLPNKEELNDLVFNVENRYYTQIIYRFPPEYVAIVVSYFEGQERYEICQRILADVEEFVKLNGEGISTKLEECI